jgi:hypothetical protein
MTATRPSTRTERVSAGIGPEPRLRLGLRARATSAVAWHRSSLIALVPTLALVGVVQAWGMYHSPALVDDEGTYVAQSWAVQHLHQLAHYTYWYDHPPLGWIQLAGWTWLTRGFERAPYSVAAGREAMWVATMVSCILLFVLARRIGMGRPFAIAAVLLFALSPLGVDYHRIVYLDNVAVPWLLAAFVLASSRRRHLGAVAGSALCFTVAVLTKETVVVLLPVLVWQVWRQSDPRIRRFSLAVFGGLLVGLVAMYPLFAALRGELLTGPGHVSLLWAVNWQVFSRPSSGSLFDPNSVARQVVGLWTDLDPWLLVAGLVCIPVGLWVRRLRPVTAALALQALMLLRGGYLPYPYVLAMLPFAALVVAGTADAAWGTTAVTNTVDRLRSTLTPRRAAVATAAAALLLLVTPAWAAGDRTQTSADRTSSSTEALDWLVTHAQPSDYLLVDDSIWTDLVERGFPMDHVIWFYKLDYDPAVQVPDGWRGLRYVVLFETNFDGTTKLPQTQAAVDHSHVVATFGPPEATLTVRQVDP